MKKFKLLALIAFSLFFIYSCNEDSNEPVISDLPDEIQALYDTPPNADDCFGGTLKMSEKLKAMDRLNYFRSIHGLPPVTYNPAKDDTVQKSALISVANKALTHFPAPSAICYSKAGDIGCQHSNLHLSWYSKFSTPWNSSLSIDGWISEEFSSSLGHRRWFLSPFLKTVSFGRVDHIRGNGEYIIGTSMHIWDINGPTTSNVEFVACPYHDYPSTAFKTGLIMNFTAIYDKSIWWNDKVTYNNTTIQVLDESNKSYTVSNQKWDNIGSGVPNSLEWKVAGLEYNKKYTVKVNSVNVNGTSKNYEYWFKLTN